MIKNVIVYKWIQEENRLKRMEFERQILSLDEGSGLIPDGVYTTFRTYQKTKVLLLESHFLRLEESAELSGKLIQIDRRQLKKAIRLAIDATPYPDTRLRISVDLTEKLGEIYLMIEELHVPAASDYEQGAAVLTQQLHRENAKVKSTKFIRLAGNIRADTAPEINETLMIAQDGRVLEGLSSNFFCLYQGKIWTAEEGVLAGITRAMVIEVIQTLHLEIFWHGIKEDELGEVDEAFITSTSRGVLPVSKINGKKVGCGKPGPVTRQIMGLFDKKIAGLLDSV